ncbi:hypothetical protein CBR_g29384 [Chara braunii]|uniref:Uncharacterized protein n=1 Tax=Chara braunii TaxID=69332 RepID=A0A388JWJ7_CHABU|nr:hypothetical protein CBR_g29384 [Chara braunii]|eukprot:GBG62184.1 hypothetical protein CBR_g29384 [Chara braunii]
MNARLDAVCESFRNQRKSSAADDQKIEKLEKEIESLRLSHDRVVRNDGASTSQPIVRDDAVLARLLQGHEEMKLRPAAVANKRVEPLEEALRIMKQQHESALTDAENWKKEARRSGNKRSRLAASPSSQLKMAPSSTPRNAQVERPAVYPAQLVHLHTLEKLKDLKELRLQELNRRREAKQEIAKLKEDLPKKEVERNAPRSAFQQKLDEVGGSTARTR